MVGLLRMWPMKRDSPDFMLGFQRGYAEGLSDVLEAGSNAQDGREALLGMAEAMYDPIGKAKRWVAEDDGSVP